MTTQRGLTELSSGSSNKKPHLDIKPWLQNLELFEYIEIFCKFKGVEDVIYMSERDLKEIGVKNGAHRAKISSSLILLREKYEIKNLHMKTERRSFNESKSQKSSRTSSHSAPTSGWTSKINSRRNSITMEPKVDSHTPEEELKKALEWELSLDNSDLRSHGWYHGTIPRQRAEELLKEDGQFLIRDCISRPGDYVLTCLWRRTPLHFVINKVVLQPYTVYERVQYQFEDECFDTVPDLVTYYVGNKKAISLASGAVISRPVNRSKPLSYYASRYGLECQMHYAVKALEQSSSDQRDYVEEPIVNVRILQPPDIPPKIGNCDANNSPPGSPVLDTIHSSITAFATLRPHHYQTVTQKVGITRVGSDPNLSPTLEKKSWEWKPSSSSSFGSTSIENDQPPPKPSRVPSFKYTQKATIVKQSEGWHYGGAGKFISAKEQRENGEEPNQNFSNNKNPTAKSQNSKSDDLLNFFTSRKKPNEKVKHMSLPRKFHRVTSGETRFSFLDSQSDDSEFADIDSSGVLTIPDLNPSSHFNLSTFSTCLLSADNKPLESSTLLRVRHLLMENGPRVLANHLTKIDLEVLKISSRHNLGLKVTSGLELLTLPQGAQLQLDLLDRLECLKYFVVVTILTCGGEAERAMVLNKWIQVAIDTKTALGNLFGFTGIMKGLVLPQVTRLRSTWFALRANFTENALTYESKLRPTLTSMEECSNPLAPNTCIPYLVSLITILQHHKNLYVKQEIRPVEEKPNTDSKEVEKPLTLGLPWEQKAADYGLQLLFTHLEMGRTYIQQNSTFKRNSEIVLENVKYDKQLLDMFKTEFHLRFLWGTKGAMVGANERCSKFDQLLTIISERCESH
ncbi:breast cancer anti-estrogen resistance protein 3 homolog isoform X1 [Tachypleus tridentatus]|uniref:breast cancer anti-estrogen resistance protein 3 homolog isoform X1 n=2 Tax=Tachypleus tridentatus TaxID=6853 RepID=UPI003FD50D14